MEPRAGPLMAYTWWLFSRELRGSNSIDLGPSNSQVLRSQNTSGVSNGGVEGSEPLGRETKNRSAISNSPKRQQATRFQLGILRNHKETEKQKNKKSPNPKEKKRVTVSVGGCWGVLSPLTDGIPQWFPYRTPVPRTPRSSGSA